MIRTVIPKEIREEVYNKFGGHCAYCGIFLNRSFHVDHIIPIAKAGVDDVMNYFPACSKCNQFKNAFSLEEFRLILQEQTLNKCSFILAERFGQITVHPSQITFYYEKCGYTFPEDLVKALMVKYPRIKPDSIED